MAGGSLIDGARIAVRTCMNVKPGEEVLVVADPPKLRIAKALVRAAEEVGAEAVLMLMKHRSRHGEEPPRAVASAMRSADVVLAPTTYSLTHTQARKLACASGARIATMPMITEAMMRRGAMLADYQKVGELALRVAKLLDGASNVEVTTPAGTDLSLSIEGRKAYPDTGMFHKPGDFGNLPAGEAFIAPVEGSAEGRLVIDGSMVELLRSGIEITVQRGRIAEMPDGPAKGLKRMLSEVGPRAFILAEFGVGTNYAARLIGNVLEDEKVLGTCHVAFGDNSTFGGRNRAGIHVDGIMLRPTIKLDGKAIMEDGRFVI